LVGFKQEAENVLTNFTCQPFLFQSSCEDVQRLKTESLKQGV